MDAWTAYLITALVMGVCGSLTNYVFHKYRNGGPLTEEGLSKAAGFGAAAGAVVFLGLGSPTTMEPMAFVVLMVTSGMGSESIVNKVIGRLKEGKLPAPDNGDIEAVIGETEPKPPTG